MRNALEKALNIALKAHAGQRDKANQPYILHPLRLMLKFEAEVLQVVAVLHDVVEDSEVTLKDLKSAGFSDEILEAIDCLTKRQNENYESFISRVALNDLARRVKLEDIKDNMNLDRLPTLSDKDLTRVEKYHRALRVLSGVK